MTHPFVVTFVHGTFARGASWTINEDAVIRKRLRDAFSEQVLFREFTWSGRNSHSERIKAGVALADDQAAVAARHPTTPRFVVAHSHGGNVALYSLRDCSENMLPAGIVTMGTPFIACKSRDMNASAPLLRMALPVVAMLVTLLVAGILWALSFNYLRFAVSETATTIIFGLGVLYIPCGALHCAVSVYRRFPRLVAWAEAKQARIIKRLQPPNRRVPKLCIHVAGDEAGAWLRFTRKLAEAPFALWRRTTALVLFVGALAANFFIFKDGIDGHGPIGALAFAVLVSTGLAASTVLLYAIYWQLFMAGLPKLVRAHGLAFGGESLLDNWLVRIAANPLPDSFGDNVTERAYTVPPGAKGLKHSWMYDQSEVADEIAGWIRLHICEHSREIATST